MCGVAAFLRQPVMMMSHTQRRGQPYWSTRRATTCRYTLLCSLVVLLTLLVLTHSAHAMHADEEGLRDWVRRFVGDVHTAVIATPSVSPAAASSADEQPVTYASAAGADKVFVASRDGAVAALALRPGDGSSELLWRVLLTDTPLCLSATGLGVVAVDASGTVYVLHPESGQLELTFGLQLPSLRARAGHIACTSDGEVAHVVVADEAGAGSRALVYVIDLNGDEVHIAPQSQRIDLATPSVLSHSTAGTGLVQDMRLSRQRESEAMTLWVNYRMTGATQRAGAAPIHHGIADATEAGDTTDEESDEAAWVERTVPSAVRVFELRPAHGSDSPELTATELTLAGITTTRVAAVTPVGSSALLHTGRHLRVVHTPTHIDDADAASNNAQHEQNENGSRNDLAQEVCVHCRGTVVIDSLTGEHCGTVTTATAGFTLTVQIVLSSASVSAAPRQITIPVTPGSRNAHPLLALLHSATGEVQLLLRTATGDLALLSSAAVATPSNGEVATEKRADTATVLWRRAEGIVHAPASAIVIPPSSAGAVDHLHFHKVALYASRRGALYSIPLAHMGRVVEMNTDFSIAVRDNLCGSTSTPPAHTPHDDDVQHVAETGGCVGALRVRGLTATGPNTVRVHVDVTWPSTATTATVLVTVDWVQKSVVSVTRLPEAVLVTPTHAVTAPPSMALMPVTQAQTAETPSVRANPNATSSSVVPAPTNHTPARADTLFFFVVNASSGEVRGFVGNTSRAGEPVVATWLLRVPHPIIAHADGQVDGRTDFVNALHIYNNQTGEEPVSLVLRRYPMRNVVALAYYEQGSYTGASAASSTGGDGTTGASSTLVVMAVDVITGSVLGRTRHRFVEGAVHMVIAENSILYHFLDAQKMRHCFGVWELFKKETASRVVRKSDGATLPQIIASFFVSNKHVFSSRAAPVPTVVISVLGTFGGPLADMSVTISRSAISRKSVVLVYANGRIAVVELQSFFAGRQQSVPNTANKQITLAVIDSRSMATHRYRLAQPSRVTVAPTALESSCHVLVSGMDMFYTRSSSGKPFDVLNSDFNKPLLVLLFCVLALLSLVTRYLVGRKGLQVLWK